MRDLCLAIKYLGSFSNISIHYKWSNDTNLLLKVKSISIGIAN